MFDLAGACKSGGWSFLSRTRKFNSQGRMKRCFRSSMLDTFNVHSKHPLDASIVHAISETTSFAASCHWLLCSFCCGEKDTQLLRLFRMWLGGREPRKQLANLAPREPRSLSHPRFLNEWILLPFQQLWEALLLPGPKDCITVGRRADVSEAAWKGGAREGRGRKGRSR